MIWVGEREGRVKRESKRTKIKTKKLLSSFSFLSVINIRNYKPRRWRSR